jgi:hypothetical protein
MFGRTTRFTFPIPAGFGAGVGCIHGRVLLSPRF